MVQYKYYYMNGRGRGEIPRLIFAFAKVPFEDLRYDYFKDFPKIKDNFNWGQLPALEVDGVQIAQRPAIIGFLARRYGLDGENEMDKVKCEEYMAAAQDLLEEYFKYYEEMEKDDKVKDKVKEAELLVNAEKATGRYLSKFEGILQKGNGFLVGGKLTYADLYLAEVVSWILEFMKIGNSVKEVEKYSGVKKHMEMVENLPGIKEWVKNRPKGLF